MIKLRAVAYPPDPSIPSLLYCPHHWIGWAGKTASRSATQERIQRDVRLYGPRGVAEAVVQVDLETDRTGRRLDLPTLLQGVEILHFERVTAECRDWVLNRIGLLHEEDFAAALTTHAATYIPRFFNIFEILPTQCLIWLDCSGKTPVSYGVLRDLSKIIGVEPKKTPPMYPVVRDDG